MHRDPDPSLPNDRPAWAGAGSRAGFTLIEVLAALVVTALIVSVVLPYAGRLATRWWVGEATIGVADGWMQAVARMSDDLAGAVPRGIGPDDNLLSAFQADPDRVSFVRPALGRPEALETVTYEIRASPAGMALVRLSHPFVADAFESGDAGGGASATLVDGRFRFSLVEIGRDGTRRTGWTPVDGMPAAVELAVRSERRADAPSAPILMPIAAQAPAVRARSATAR